MGGSKVVNICLTHFNESCKKLKKKQSQLSTSLENSRPDKENKFLLELTLGERTNKRDRKDHFSNNVSQ